MVANVSVSMAGESAGPPVGFVAMVSGTAQQNPTTRSKLVLAGVLPVGADHHGNPPAVLVPQAGGVDERGHAGGAARREPRRESRFGLFGREQSWNVSMVSGNSSSS